MQNNLKIMSHTAMIKLSDVKASVTDALDSGLTRFSDAIAISCSTTQILFSEV